MIRRGHDRVARAVIYAAVLAALAVVPAADAGAPVLTWQQAAARLHAPVYRPRITLGIKPQALVINQGGCLNAAWGSAKTQKGPHFSIDEPGVTSQCGQPGEADEVSTAVIHGKKVSVLVQCRHLPHCTVHDGETDGFFIIFVPESGAKDYVIQLGSSHVSLRNLIRVAKSFVRVAAPHKPATAAPRSATSATSCHRTATRASARSAFRTGTTWLPCSRWGRATSATTSSAPRARPGFPASSPLAPERRAALR